MHASESLSKRNSHVIGPLVRAVQNVTRETQPMYMCTRYDASRGSYAVDLVRSTLLAVLAITTRVETGATV